MKIIKSKIEMAETHSIRENGCHKSHFIDFSTFGTCLLCACIFACVGVNSRAKNCSLTQSCIVIHRRWASFRFQHSTPNSRFSSSQPKHNPQLFRKIEQIFFHLNFFEKSDEFSFGNGIEHGQFPRRAGANRTAQVRRNWTFVLRKMLFLPLFPFYRKNGNNGF